MLEVLHETSHNSPLIALFTRYILGLNVNREIYMEGQDTKNFEHSENTEKLQNLNEEKQNNKNNNNEDGDQLRDTLIHRINSHVSSVSYAALQLFNSLLEVHDPHVLENLILRNVVEKEKDETVTITDTSSTAVTTSTATPTSKIATTTPMSKNTPNESQTPSNETKRNSAKELGMETPLKRQSLKGSLMSPTEVFLDGFPGSPKPKPGTATRPLVFEDYLTDAHTQSVARMARMAVYWSDNMLSSTGTPRKKSKSNETKTTTTNTTSK